MPPSARARATPSRRAVLRAGLGGPGACLLGSLLPACASGRRAGLPPTPRRVATFGGRGTGPGQLHGPIGIAFDPVGELLVTDLHNGRVQRLGLDGAFRGAFELPRDMETAHGRSASAGGIAVGPDRRVYVTLMASHRVLILGPDGERLGSFGERGSAAGQLDEPGGVAVDAEGVVYVADQVNRRIQVFSPEGRFRSTFGSYGVAAGAFDGIEPPSSRFGGPSDVALDGRGHLFTTEGAAGRVQRFTTAGEPCGSFGSKGAGPGGFGGLATDFSPNTLGPVGVCADGNGRVWVSSLNGRVQLFEGDGTFLAAFGRPGSGPGELRTPHGLALDGRGHLYVVDSGNHRVHKLAV
ncbi:MAG: NHL repeat-containing protein [Planctomycetota bacterium]